MDFSLILKFATAFVFVISLMLLLGWAIKRMGLSGAALTHSGRRRLKMVEYLPLDHRRRLVLVRRDDKDHLLVLGPDGETVIETGIPVLESSVVTLKQGVETLKDVKHAGG